VNPVEISHLTKHYPDFSLNDVTFSVPAGYVTGFVGANGSGKTTTIKAALGMIHPDAGSATTLGHERIGVVFDAPPYNPEWRLKDLGRGIGRFYPTWSQERYDAELQAAGLAPTKKVKELSRGMGMRLQMAVALAPDLDRLADYLVILSRGRVVANGTAEEIIDSFRLVRGIPEHLTDAVRQASLGLRSTSLGWEAMMPADAAEALTDRIVVEVPTIEDLAVHIAKEAGRE